MDLFFRDMHGKKRLVQKCVTEDEAIEAIRKFCDDKNFKINYIRSWVTDGVKTYDVGSHCEFFVLYGVNV